MNNDQKVKIAAVAAGVSALVASYLIYRSLKSHSEQEIKPEENKEEVAAEKPKEEFAAEKPKEEVAVPEKKEEP